MKPITVWERYSESHKAWEHNHIEDGHTVLNTPKAHTKDQERGWNGVTWQSEFAYLDENNVVVQGADINS